MSDDLTVHILTEIRDELRGTNARLDQTNQRLDQTNQRLDQTNQRLDQTRTELRGDLVAAELRLATRFVELTAASRDVHELLTDRFELRERVERVEQDVAELKKRGEPTS